MNWNTKTDEQLENLPKGERIKHRSRGGTKDFNWQHFYGFLESRVGLPVDRVIHEFVNCDWCPPRHRTFRQFCEGVEMNTFKKADGRIWYFCGWSNGQERCVDTDGNYFVHRKQFFYLHPDTKILCVKKRQGKHDFQTRYRAERKAKLRILGDYHQLYKLNGTWYEVKAEPLPDDSLVWNKERKAPHDILLESNSTSYWWSPYRDKSHPYVKITLKRQLGSKELKHHGLKNDLPDEGVPRCEKCGGHRCTHWWQAKWDKERQF